MGNRLTHTGTFRGKRVRVKLKDGTVIIAKFHDRNDRYVFLEGYRRISKSDIDSFGNYKDEKRPD